jgi:hypothetical protein
VLAIVLELVSSIYPIARSHLIDEIKKTIARLKTPALDCDSDDELVDHYFRPLLCDVVCHATFNLSSVFWLGWLTVQRRISLVCWLWICSEIASINGEDKAGNGQEAGLFRCFNSQRWLMIFRTTTMPETALAVFFLFSLSLSLLSKILLGCFVTMRITPRKSEGRNSSPTVDWNGRPLLSQLLPFFFLSALVVMRIIVVILNVSFGSRERVPAFERKQNKTRERNKTMLDEQLNGNSGN